MGWRGLLRVVDFDRLLTAQATVAESLEKAAVRSGADSEDARVLRQGFNLLAKVLFTRRVSIPDLHDLAWLDHLVATDERPSRTWHGERSREAWDRFASNRGHLGGLVPRPRHASWVTVPLPELPAGEPLRAERGAAGPFLAGLVPHDDVLELIGELGALAPKSDDGREILRELQRQCLAVRREARSSVALVFAASA